MSYRNLISCRFSMFNKQYYMNKINSIVLLITVLIIGVSCDKTNNSLEVVDNYDHEGQIAKDNDSINQSI